MAYNPDSNLPRMSSDFRELEANRKIAGSSNFIWRVQNMKKTLILSFLLLSAIWVMGQAYPSQNPSQSSSQPSTQTSSSDNQTTVQGCLSGSSGSYTLTDNSGTTYQLAGDTAKLSDHVGHKVEITGTTTPSSASSGGAATSAGSSGTKAQPTLNVTSFKHISSSCSASR
jgi:hypothetical protein